MALLQRQEIQMSSASPWEKKIVLLSCSKLPPYTQNHLPSSAKALHSGWIFFSLIFISACPKSINEMILTFQISPPKWLDQMEAAACCCSSEWLWLFCLQSKGNMGTSQPSAYGTALLWVWELSELSFGLLREKQTFILGQVLTPPWMLSDAFPKMVPAGRIWGCLGLMQSYLRHVQLFQHYSSTAKMDAQISVLGGVKRKFWKSQRVPLPLSGILPFPS